MPKTTLYILAARTEKGIAVNTNGIANIAFETTYVPRPNIGKHATDLILDQAYLRDAKIVLNGETVIEKFDIDENDDYDKLAELLGDIAK